VGQEQRLVRVQVVVLVPLLVVGRVRARRKRRETTWFWTSSVSSCAYMG
jgi:hypothetical protein